MDKEIALIILVSIQLLILFAIIIDLYLTISRRKRLRYFLDEAINIDGSHHKQWLLHRIAEVLNIKIESHDDGIAP
jgi:hypothetical protein